MKQYILLLLIICFSTMAQEVTEIKTPFEGSSLFVPKDNSKKYPGIIIFHGSEGGINGRVRQQAKILARKGYAALFYCYFDCKRFANENSKELKNVELQTAYNAFLWLKKLKYTTSKVGIYGVSRGAEMALLLTTVMQKGNLEIPDAVAVHAPTDKIVTGFNPRWRWWMCWQFDKDTKKYKWDRQCGDKRVKSEFDTSYPAWIFNGTPTTITAGTRIEIEKYLGPILITHGMADKTWNVKRTKNIETSILEARKNQPTSISPEIHFFKDQKHRFDKKSEIKRWTLLSSFLKRNLKD